MKLAHPLRIISVTIFSVTLAGLLAAQSAGIAFTRKKPDTSVALFHLNGLAMENLASAVFKAELDASQNVEKATQAARSVALVSYRKEPLTPEAHAILALSQDKAELRSRTISQAARLDKREPMLQGLVLQEYVENGNYSGVVTTLDRILRVKPARSKELFPILLNAFVQEGAVEQFAQVLNGTSPWHERFLKFAVRQDEALANLAKLRQLMPFGDEAVDQALLRNLANQGQIETAYSLYSQISEATDKPSQEGLLQWTSDYAPFDWRFADKADFRAQQSLKSEELEIYVRAGQGGIFASRVMKAPQVPFTITAQHEITPRELAEDVKFFVGCTENSQAFYEARFGADSFQQSINSLPLGCDFIEVQLHARAWSGKSALRGTISPLRISQ